MTFTSTTIRELRALGLDQATFDKVLEIFERARESKPKKKGCAADRQERGTRLPEDWALPVEYREWALAIGLRPGEVEREAIKFRNYWHGRNDSKAFKIKWFGTWQNWCLGMLERAGREPNKPNGTPATVSTGPETFTDATWRAIAKRHKAGAPWNPEWGPPPGRMDCQMPVQYL